MKDNNILIGLGLFMIAFVIGFTSSMVNIAVVPSNTTIINEPLNMNKLHNGEVYSTSYEFNVSSGNTIYLKGNSSRQVHLLERLIYATTTGVNIDYEIRLYEGGTDTSATNILDTFNVNRAYTTNSNTFTIYSSVSGVNLATATQLPFGNRMLSDKKFSSEAISTTEYILNNNTNYYLAITNNDGGVLTMNIRWLWYEE